MTMMDTAPTNTDEAPKRRIGRKPGKMSPEARKKMAARSKATKAGKAYIDYLATGLIDGAKVRDEDQILAELGIIDIEAVNARSCDDYLGMLHLMERRIRLEAEFEAGKKVKKLVGDFIEHGALFAEMQGISRATFQHKLLGFKVPTEVLDKAGIE